MHAEYEAQLLAEPSDFSSQWGNYLRHALGTTLIDASARPMLAAYWAASPAIHTFEPEIRAAVVNAASHQISLSKNHPESTLLAQKLRALIETGGTEKVPERVPEKAPELKVPETAPETAPDAAPEDTRAERTHAPDN